ncbi:MAG: redox-sensing transcriptional repressor Rex [Spirochaetaceae bacterium]|jgi:redox-sensing transcriptional repressor|nr:redox-sensing transcriptional repressor Rex [Spirochaetaceae bacterium]
MNLIPEPTKERLLTLMRLLEKNSPAAGRAAGKTAVTSAELEALTGWSSQTIRKDISCLGGCLGDESRGSPGKLGSNAGYTAENLVPLIKRALGLDHPRRFCIAGLGRLGSAYLNVRFFEAGEFELCAGFDTNVNRVEILKSPAPLYPAYKMEEVIRRFSIEIALLCVPGDAAQAVGERLAAAGIRGILNFAPVALNLPPELAVRNVNVADELRALAMKINV